MAQRQTQAAGLKPTVERAMHYLVPDLDPPVSEAASLFASLLAGPAVAAPVSELDRLLAKDGPGERTNSAAAAQKPTPVRMKCGCGNRFCPYAGRDGYGFIPDR
jgi:hypothetical protein